MSSVESHATANSSQPHDWSPPYTSFTTLMNTVQRMADEGGVPARIDRSYLSNMPGGVRPTFVASLRSLGLIDNDAKPTPTLINLVNASEDDRKVQIEELVQQHYAEPLSLGPMATQAQLEDVFRAYGIQGSTMRKAVGFFLAAAKYAGIKVSPHFKLPKAEPGDRRPRKTRDVSEQQAPSAPQPPSPPTPNQPKLHPFIEGLVGSLPEPGSPFPERKQEAWFDTARGIFRLIYTTEKSGHDSGTARDTAAVTKQEDESD